ncbi:MAG TPA: fumarylacetoacetate hydrolase family protein [Actinomycetota bacterium]|nr:fumarylacetoacetate hydrolase family protein [Actinomycetota bacterium]
MKLATLRIDGGTRAVRVDGDRALDLGCADVGEWLARRAAGRAASDVGDDLGPVDHARFAPPVLRPSKIVCIGHNYRTHIEEMGRSVPDYPTLFAKFARALVGARDPILLPPESEAMDWEAELAVVVGAPVRRATPDGARAAIAGYTVLNDVTARDWQRRTPQWLQGKTFEGTTPIGPVVVTPDEVDHAADLAVRCEVNGAVMQHARTSDLLFGPAEAIAYVSRIVTLEPGDVVSTGTTGGVGAAREPAVFLQPGDEVRTSIEGIGELVNVCVAEAVEHP